MKSNMKTILSLLLGAVMLVGLLAGCGAKAPQASVPTQPQVAKPTVGGMLLVNVNAAVEIIYDSDSFVMEMRGVDANGEEIVAAQGDVLGKDIGDVVKALATTALKDGYLIDGEKAIVVKQCLGSTLPGAAFMEGIQADIESVADGFPIYIVSEDMLDEMGYITSDACKQILAAALKVDDFEYIEVNTETENGRYVMHLPINDKTEYFTVDYNLGTVRAAELSEYDEDAINGVESEELIIETYPEEPELPEETEDTSGELEEDVVI